MSDTFDIAVIGGGIAGLTAAYHAASAGARVLHARSAEEIGGLVCNVGRLDAVPGLRPLSGMELAQHLCELNAQQGVVTADCRIETVTRADDDFALQGDGRSWRTRQVIGATGAVQRALDVPGAQSLAGRGLSYCGWCDGGLFRGKDVVVLGGGNAAFQEALHLAKLAASVTLVTHGERFRAKPVYVNAAADDEKFSFRWNAQAIEIAGQEKVEAVILRNRANGAIEEFGCDGVFVFIGLEPGSNAFGELAQRDSRGWVRTDACLETSTPGLFAVGAMRSGYCGQLTSAMGEATTAALIAAGRCRT